MKKIFGFMLLGMLISSFAMAQIKTRKVPFLPYTGMTTVPVSSETSRPVARAPASNPYETVYFDKGSSSLRADQKQKLVQIGKRLEKEGSGHYSVIAFTTPNISKDLAERRAEIVVQALSDFRVGSPVIHYEHRKSAVINPNRVEVYMRASTHSLGTTSSNFGQP